MTNPITFMGTKALNAKIKWIAATAKKLDPAIHEAGIHCMIHARETGDVRMMHQLAKALPQSSRAKAFQQWVNMFSPIRWDKDGNLGLMKPEAKGYVPFNVEAANDIPFWQATDEKVSVKELSVEAFKAMIGKFLKDLEEANADGEVFRKDGTIKARIKGDIVQLKEYVKAKAA